MALLGSFVSLSALRHQLPARLRWRSIYCRMPNRAIPELRPNSLTDYVDLVEELQTKSVGPIWYRGSSIRSNSLLPSLYRERENPRAPRFDLSTLETQLVTKFRARSLPYHNRDLTDTLETLFFMQHYMIPTRLLDWTENPFAGLFFALRTSNHRVGPSGRLVYEHDAAVWVLDPSRWNQAALRHLSYQGGPLDPGHEALGAYKMVGSIDELAEEPVALFGAHNSPRIVAQQGTFVIFGSKTTPMDDLYRWGAYPLGSLTRIRITRGVIATLRQSLFRNGITEGSMFPDLEGLGRDLRRSFGFDV